MPPPLTSAWFADARALAADLPTIDGLGFRVEHRSSGPDGPTWHQEVQDGRVVSWDLGPLDDPDLVLIVDDDVVDRIHDPEIDGTEALASVRVLRDDGQPGLPAPMDITESVEIQQMPEVLDANLRVQYHLFGGPFGDVDTWWIFEQGRYAEAALGAIDDADVEVWAGFSKMSALRLGEITVLEALEDGGRVVGDVGPLMLLAGLHEGDELGDAQAAAGSSGVVLAAMGRLRATEAYQRVLASLTGS